MRHASLSLIATLIGPLSFAPACSTGDEPESPCGNGTLDEGEECDGALLADETCVTLGYDEGDLACDSACRFDARACERCGDGVRSGAERCDGDDLGGETCALLGLSMGTLRCHTTCTAQDTTLCRPVCDEDEDCDVDARCVEGHCRNICSIRSECNLDEHCGATSFCTPGCGIDLDCADNEDCIDGVCTRFEPECSNVPGVCDCPDPSTICFRFRCVSAEPCVTDADCACSDLNVPVCNEINGACIDIAP